MCEEMIYKYRSPNGDCPVTTDAQLFDELATEIEDILKSPDAGKIIDDQLLLSCLNKINTIMSATPSPPDTRICIQRDINNALRSVLVDDAPWDDSVRLELFRRQVATLGLLRSNGTTSTDALLELALFLRQFVVGLETFRGKLLRR